MEIKTIVLQINQNKMKCSKCGDETHTKSYYCKPCKAEYQREGRCDNRVDKNTKSKQQNKLTDNYSNLF